MASSSRRKWSDLKRVLPSDSSSRGRFPVWIHGLADDSRVVTPGDLFFAVPGARFDGGRFARRAVEAGAVAVVSEDELDLPSGTPRLRVPDVRVTMARVARAFWGDLFHDLKLLGVTGTNGKTTCTWLTREILNHGGWPTASIGTLGVFFPDGRHRTLGNTTPGTLELYGLLSELRAAGARWVVMEVSSQAAVQHRVEGMPFRGAAFTNLTPEHLELHGSFEQYREAKLLWFRQCARAGEDEAWTAIVNRDDPSADAFLDLRLPRVMTFSPGGMDASLRARDVLDSLDGIRFTLRFRDETFPCRLPMPGRFNVENALAAAGLALSQGLAPEVVRSGLEAATTVPGRVCPVPGPRRVLVDYAHSSDAMEKLLATLKPLVGTGKLGVVFGCGGDRDTSKRARMGHTVARFADRAYLTNDNPRSENPEAIAAMILEGVGREDRGRFVVELDRRRAIERALRDAGGEDLVVIAGKGHEDYQIFGERRSHFDDREEALRVQECLRVEERGPLFSLVWMEGVLGQVPRNRSGAGVDGFAIDSRAVVPGEAFIAIRGERFDGARFARAAVERGARAVIAESDHGDLGELPNLFVVPDAVAALTALARAHRDRHEGIMIAVTGTNGKTTTKDVIASVLSVRHRVVATAGNFNNHIGLPLSLLRLRPEHEVGVWELGMSSRGEIAHLTKIVRPDVGVLTNVGPAHLEFLGTVGQVAEAKAELLEGMSESSLLVANAGCRWARSIATRHRGPVVWAGLGRRGDARLLSVSVQPDRLEGRMRLGPAGNMAVTWPVSGRHMAYPFLMAALVARHLGFDDGAIQEGFAACRATGGRMRFFRRGGICFVDDTYNANPASMTAALDYLRDVEVPGRRWAVLGDMLEMGRGSGEAHRRILRRCEGAKWLEACWLLGEEFGKISPSKSRSERVRIAFPREEIGRDLREALRPGDVVLFKGSRGVRVEEILRAVLGDALD